MAWRVYFPLITHRSWADFELKPEAERFAAEKRNRATSGRYGMLHAWRQVEVVEITGEARVG